MVLIHVLLCVCVVVLCVGGGVIVVDCCGTADWLGVILICAAALDLIHLLLCTAVASPRTSILSDPYPPAVRALKEVEAYLREANGVDVGKGRRVIRSSHRAGSTMSTPW